MSDVAELAPRDGADDDDEEVSIDDLMMSDGEDEPSEDVAVEPDASGAAAPSLAGEDADTPSVAASPDEAAVAEQEAVAAAAAEAADRVAARRATVDAEAAASDGDEAPAARADVSVDDAEPRPDAEGAPAGEATSAEADDAVTVTGDEPPGDRSDAGEPALEEASAELEAPTQEEPPSAQLDDDDERTLEPPHASAERETSPESIRAKHGDAPLPSFDIPEAPSEFPRTTTPRSTTPAAFPAPPPAPPPAPAISLSEVAEEDDDDAVTHIGVPLPEADDFPESDAFAAEPEYDSADEAAGPEADPEMPAAFPPAPGFEPGEFEVPQGDFEVGAAGLAAFEALDPEAALREARRAKTVVVPRLDPSVLQSDTAPAAVVSARRSSNPRDWWSRMRDARRGSSPDWRSLAYRYGPRVSLVLFGAGIGAVGIALYGDGARSDARAAAETQSVQALKQDPAKQAAKPETLVERARAGDEKALFRLGNAKPAQRTAEMTLALEEGKRAQKLNEFQAFADSLKTPAGRAAPNLLVRFMGYATSPETMVPAFQALLSLEGERGPDMLYAVWEKAPVGSRASSLAPQLLYSSDMRARATPALAAALSLSEAKTCDDYLDVLPRVLQHGDQRCRPTMRSLKHTDGCGDDGQADCYACLREGTLLDDALAAIEERPAPKL